MAKTKLQKLMASKARIDKKIGKELHRLGRKAATKRTKKSKKRKR